MIRPLLSPSSAAISRLPVQTLAAERHLAPLAGWILAAKLMFAFRSATPYLASLASSGPHVLEAVLFEPHWNPPRTAARPGAFLSAL